MILLASASPRRRELLSTAGIDHLVRPTSVPEVRQPSECAEDFVRRLARDKAAACPRTKNDIVIGADTVVCVQDSVLGKPKDRADAHRMLRLLSGKSHWVHTGICLLQQDNCILDLASTEVLFEELSDLEISEYTQSGEPLDKAGAYAIQGVASRFVVSICGSYSNAVGLPVALVYKHLKRLSL